jgi:hypothetical protein
MIIKDFSLDVITEHQTWYLLHNNYQTGLTIMRPTPVGPEPYTDYSAYKMADGRVLIGFNKLVATVLSQGLVALGDDGSEYITTQVWERISDICQIAPPNDDLGTFAFVDSQPPSILEPHKDWRCDKEYYGPYPYPTLEGVILDPFNESSVIVAFEPIISIAGIGHLIYMQRTNYKEQRNELVNNAITPMTAPTLSETLKLIYEWSLVAEEPFSNQELIAQDARAFVQNTGLTSDLLNSYPNMQIVKFLSGDGQARVRPADAVAPQVDLLEFIQKRVSHISLTQVALLNPSIWNSDEIAMAEQDLIQTKCDSFVTQHMPNMFTGINANNVEEVFSSEAHSAIIPFLKEWLSLINKSYNP